MRNTPTVVAEHVWFCCGRGIGRNGTNETDGTDGTESPCAVLLRPCWVGLESQYACPYTYKAYPLFGLFLEVAAGAGVMILDFCEMRAGVLCGGTIWERRMASRIS